MSAYTFFKPVVAPLIRFLYRVKIQGAENEPKGEAYIVASNHSSFIDPVIVGASVKETQRFVARSSLARFPLIAFFFKIFNAIPIHRGEPDLTAFRKSAAALKNGECVTIFPQGTRMRGIIPKPEQALGGIALIGAMTKAPVLPIAIVTKHKKPRLFCKTRIIIQPPISYGEYSSFKEKPSKKEMAEYCFAPVCKCFEEQ